MTDPLLAPFIAATNERQASDALGRLLAVDAAPVIARVLRAKLGSQTAEAPDLTSAARAELIERLLALRQEDDASAIGNFRGYVAAVTYNVWAQHLRVERPARAMLLNRLRYLLENRSARRGFALWDGTDGARWCGLDQWQTRLTSNAFSPKAQWLTMDPTAAARDAFGRQDWTRLDLAALLVRLFTWLGEPLELRELVAVLSELLQISDEKEAFVDEASEGPQQRIAHPGATPHEEVKWQEYLRWLWQEVGTLSVPQRSAFLLHSEITIEFDFRGIASVRQIASALGIAAEEFAALWSTLPLNDLIIATRLRLSRQQVINLRRVARDRLGAAWRNWIN